MYIYAMMEVKIKQRVKVSDRDRDIVRGLSNGLTAKKISEVTCPEIGARTVESIIEKLRKKFDCHTSAQLVAVFMRHKLIK